MYRMRMSVFYERLQSGSMQPSSREGCNERTTNKIRFDRDGYSSFKKLQLSFLICFSTIQICFSHAYISYISRKIAEESKYNTRTIHI